MGSDKKYICMNVEQDFQMLQLSGKPAWKADHVDWLHVRMLAVCDDQRIVSADVAVRHEQVSMQYIIKGYTRVDLWIRSGGRTSQDVFDLLLQLIHLMIYSEGRLLQPGRFLISSKTIWIDPATYTIRIIYVPIMLSLTSEAISLSLGSEISDVGRALLELLASNEHTEHQKQLRALSELSSYTQADLSIIREKLEKIMEINPPLAAKVDSEDIEKLTSYSEESDQENAWDGQTHPPTTGPFDTIQSAAATENRFIHRLTISCYIAACAWTVYVIWAKQPWSWMLGSLLILFIEAICRTLHARLVRGELSDVEREDERWEDRDLMSDEDQDEMDALDKEIPLVTEMLSAPGPTVILSAESARQNSKVYLRMITNDNESTAVDSPNCVELCSDQEGVEFWIGRQGANVNWALPDPSVSRVHAKIEYGDGHFLITDLGSTNGTKVNEQRIKSYQPQKLEIGDRLSFAGINCRIQSVS